MQGAADVRKFERYLKLFSTGQVFGASAEFRQLSKSRRIGGEWCGPLMRRSWREVGMKTDRYPLRSLEVTRNASAHQRRKSELADAGQNSVLRRMKPFRIAGEPDRRIPSSLGPEGREGHDQISIRVFCRRDNRAGCIAELSPARLAGLTQRFEGLDVGWPGIPESQEPARGRSKDRRCLENSTSTNAWHRNPRAAEASTAL